MFYGKITHTKKPNTQTLPVSPHSGGDNILQTLESIPQNLPISTDLVESNRYYGLGTKKKCTTYDPDLTSSTVEVSVRPRSQVCWFCRFLSGRKEGDTEEVH